MKKNLFGFSRNLSYHLAHIFEVDKKVQFWITSNQSKKGIQ